MSNLVAGPAVPPTELIVGQKYEIRFRGRRINSGTYEGAHKSPGFLFFLVDKPKNTKQVVSDTHTFHPLMPPKSVTEQRMLEQMYRGRVGLLPANVLGLVGEFTNAKNPYDLYKDETTGTGTGVSLPRGGRKTRTRKTRKRKTRRQRR
jgi:hypothetical protein